MPSGTPVRQALATLAAEHADIDWLASEVDSLCAEAPEADVGQLLSIRASLAGPDGRDSAAVTTDAVQLLTFHRAKGLEWSGVAVVGLEAGMVPIAHAIRSEALDEERRLLYVALTRAERDLWCSFARHRNVRDRNWNCEPSPYLSAMRLAATAVPNPDPVSPSVHIEQLRSRLAIAR
jgi:DNA helicase-2/ATP-dependent DNA helicase PcrA